MSKKKLSGKRLVIQFGRYMTQIVLVNAKGHIQHAATVSTPLGAVEDGMIQDMDAMRDMLKEALRAPEFKRTYEVVFTLSTSQVIAESSETNNNSYRTIFVKEAAAKPDLRMEEISLSSTNPIPIREFAIPLEEGLEVALSMTSKLRSS